MSQLDRRWGVVWGLLVLAAATDARGQNVDSIQGISGAGEFGTVMEMSRTEVVFDVRGLKKKYAVNEIRRIKFAEEPRELTRGRDAALDEKYEEAKAELAKVVTDGITKPFLLQDIEYFRAYVEAQLALTAGGDKVNAVRVMRAFAENPANQNSYHFFAAVRILGDLAVALNSFDNAVKYYGQLAEAPWPEYKMQASLYEAHALAAGQKWNEALGKYNEILAVASDSTEAKRQKKLAKAGKARCLAFAGSPEEGVKLAEELIAENDSQAEALLFGRAYVALGNCYLKMDQPQDALMAFLTVDTLFYREAETHAEALYHLVQLWRDVNKSDRAIKAQSLLQNRYGGTSWAKKG